MKEKRHVKLPLFLALLLLVQLLLPIGAQASADAGNIRATLQVNTIVSGCAAYLTVSVTGDLGESDAYAQIFGVSEKIISGTARIGLKASDVPSVDTATVFSVSIIIDEDVAASAPITVVPLPASIWRMGVSSDDETVTLAFSSAVTSYNGYEATLNAAAAVVSQATENTLQMENTLIEGSNIISVKGVTYPLLFPSYSFTFSAVYEYIPEINDAPVEGVELDKAGLSLAKGDVAVLNATVLPKNAADKGVKWSTDNARVADVYMGVITATGEGTAVITVTTDDGAKTATCSVTVTDASVGVSSIKFYSSTATLAVGETGQLGVEISPAYAGNQNVTYISSAPDVASVSASGVITGIAAGSAIITATSGDGAKTDTCTVTVTDSLAPFNLHNPDEAKTDTAATLLWDKSSNLYTTDLEYYEVYRDGALIGTTAKMGYSVTGLDPDTAYTFRVDAKRKSGGTDTGPSIAVTTKPAAAAILDITKPPYNAVADGGFTASLITYTDNLTAAHNSSTTVVNQTTGTINTEAIQKAIDDCPAGGTVYIPEGTFVSGPLFLKSDMTLKVDGTLLATTDLSLYPRIPCMFEGWEIDNSYASLITIGERDTFGPYNIKNVTLCGSGRIDASGLALDVPQGGTGSNSTTNNKLRERGRAVMIMNAQNVYVRDLDIGFGPSWTIHSIFSDHITYDGLIVQAKTKDNSTRVRNGDGIGPESCTNVNIFDVTFHSGDDSIAIKSGKNILGWMRNKASAGIRVTNCYIDRSQGGIVIGSEMSGGVRNVLIQDNDIRNISWEGLDIKSDIGRGGLVEGIVYKDIRLSGVRIGARISFKYSTNNDGDKAPVPPEVRNILFENITGTTGSGKPAFEIIGLDSSQISNVTIANCALTNVGTKSYDTGVTCASYLENCDAFTVRNVSINNNEGKPWGLIKATNIDYISPSLIVNAPDPANVLIETVASPAAVMAVSTGDSKSITVIPGSAVGVVIGDLTSTDNSVQSYSIVDSDRTPKTGDAIVAEGDNLVVTSEDKSATAEYTVLMWEPSADPILLTCSIMTPITVISGQSYSTANSNNTVSGQYVQFRTASSIKIGDWIQFSGAAPAGTYTVKFRFKYNNNGRGACNLFIDDKLVGYFSEENEDGFGPYVKDQYYWLEVGSVTLDSDGTHAFRFEATTAGKNIVFDQIELIPAG